MARLTLDQKIQNMTDDEKVRVLYRIEIVQLNKKLSKIFAQTSDYIRKYSYATADFLRRFYTDEDLASTEEINDRLIKGDVCDYFDAYTMKAYANYSYEFCKAFDKHKIEYAKEYYTKKTPVDWKKVSKKAYKAAENDAIKIIFQEMGVRTKKLRILDEPVTEINSKKRQEAKDLIINYLQLDKLYFNEDKEWETKLAEEELYKAELKAKKEQEEVDRIGIKNPDYMIYDESFDDEDDDEDENENY